MGESDLNVTLIKWTPNPEQLIAVAARLYRLDNIVQSSAMVENIDSFTIISQCSGIVELFYPLL